MVQNGKVFCKQVCEGEEWARRLGKLILHTKEPILRMTVLQHLSDWIEMFAPITNVNEFIKKGNELIKAGHALPRPSPNAKAHAARLLQIDEQEKAARSQPATPAKEEEPAAKEEEEEEEEDDDDDSDDDDDIEMQELPEIEEEPFDPGMS